MPINCKVLWLVDQDIDALPPRQSSITRLLNASMLWDIRRLGNLSRIIDVRRLAIHEELIGTLARPFIKGSTILIGTICCFDHDIDASVSNLFGHENCKCVKIFRLSPNIIRILYFNCFNPYIYI